MGKVQYIIFNWQSKPSILSQLEFQKGCSEVKCRMETGFNVRGWRNSAISKMKLARLPRIFLATRLRIQSGSLYSNINDSGQKLLTINLIFRNSIKQPLYLSKPRNNI